MDSNKVLKTGINTKSKLIEKNILKKRVTTYLAFVYGFVLLGWFLVTILPSPLNNSAYVMLISVFSLLPVLSCFLTRLITKDKSPWMIRPNFISNWRIYLMSAFIPGTLIFLGAVLFFLIFPNQLDVTATKLIEVYGKFGVPTDLPHTINSIITIGVVGIFISPFIVPVVIIALGEEVGWRGYLLPIFLKLMSKQRAVLLNGVLWGLCHAPLIYFGFNYGLNYWFAPYAGILMMILVCTVLGVWLSYVTIKSNSVIPASILHGSANVIGEWPVLVTIPGISTLWGPNPTGFIGMVGLLLGAVIILRVFLKKLTN